MEAKFVHISHQLVAGWSRVSVPRFPKTRVGNLLFRSFKKSDKSNMSGSLFSLLWTQERFCFKSGLCSFLKRKLKTGHISRFLALLRVRNSLFCSSRFYSFKKSERAICSFLRRKKTIRTKETKSEFSTLPNLVTVSLYLLLLWLDPGAVPLRDVLDPGDGDVHQHQPHPHSSQLIHEHPHLRIQGETSPPVVTSQILIAVNSSMNKLIYAFKVRQALQ